MNKQTKMLPWLGYGVSFFLILIALAGFRLYIARNSGKLINYEMTINADRAINSGMEMDIHIYNDWVDSDSRPSSGNFCGQLLERGVPGGRREAAGGLCGL